MQTKDAYYFPHDSNAHNDDKILILRHKFGWEGYGLYWAIIERLRDSRGYVYNSHAIEGLSLGLSTPYDQLKEIIKYCVEIGLLSEENGCFYSDSLCRRMVEVDRIREKLSNAGKKGADKRWGGHKGSHGDPIAIKESKEDKIKYLDFVLLTEKEHQALIDKFGEKGTEEKIRNLNYYIGSKGRKYKSHYHTIMMWENKNNKKEEVKLPTGFKKP